MLYWTAVLLIGAGVFLFFLMQSGVGTFPPASFRRMLSGTADRPYVYRHLLPLAAHLLSPVLPKQSARQIEKASETILGAGFFREKLDGTSYPSETVLILIMMYAALIGFAITMRRFVRDLGYSSRVQFLFPPMVLLGSAVFFLGFGRMYDFPLLLFFSLGLYLMYREAWAWYLLVFACGTLNKETTILLYPAFALYFFSRMPRRKFVVLSGCQFGIYVMIQGIIRFVFRDNSGAPVEWHFHDWITQLGAIAKTAPYLPALWAVVLLVTTIAVLHQWPNKPAFIRLALSILPVFVILLVVWGFPLEIRGMLEVYPIVAILVLPPPIVGTPSHVPADLRPRPHASA